jgi:hypothetical protein
MGMILTATTGFVIVLVMWALGVKAIDATLIAGSLILVAAVVRGIVAYLPSTRARAAEELAGGRRPRA